ncbi:MAG: hypothetical protein IPG54_13835 [Sphingomonadales bacterium]|nr:hypothetical protein [Sphingomonadales bacterium]
MPDTICAPRQGSFEIRTVLGDGKIGPEQRRQFDQWRAAILVPLDRSARYRPSRATATVSPSPIRQTAPLDCPYFSR